MGASLLNGMNETMIKPQHYKKLIVSLTLVLATLAVLWPVRHHQFVTYDDHDYVVENRQVRAGLTVQGIRWAFTSKVHGHWHPLTWLSHMTDCQLFGLNPAGHHLVNLLFHIANVLLLFLVLKRMTGDLWKSAFVTAVFSLHPLNVESVAWVSERKNVVSTLFWMLTILTYVRYSERPGLSRYLLIVAAFILGLMSKKLGTLVTNVTYSLICHISWHLSYW